MYNIPGEKYTGQPIINEEWEGPGWYASARRFPGSEVYTLTRVPESWFGNNYKYPNQQTLDAVTRSFGHGTLRWYNELPTAVPTVSPTVTREQIYNCAKCQASSVQIREELSDGGVRWYIQPRNHAKNCPSYRDKPAYTSDDRAK